MGRRAVLALIFGGLLAFPAYAAGSNPTAAGSWSASSSKSVQGCASAVARLPHWSAANRTGTLRLSSSSRICPKSRGEGMFGSSTLATATFTWAGPVTLGSGSGGVNISWRLSAAIADAATLSAPRRCPLQTTVSDLNLGYSWYNFTAVSSSCYDLGSATLGGFSYVEDLTTGAEIVAQNTWTGCYNLSGVENDSYAYSATYSNASYWSYNASGSYAFNLSYGSSGSVVGSFRPTWFTNGTFVALDRYEVVTVLEGETETQTVGYPAGSSSASVDLASAGRSFALLSVTNW